MQLTIPDEALQQALKTVLTEMLQKRDAAVMDVLIEILEDAALGQAMTEGDRQDVVDVTKFFR